VRTLPDLDARAGTSRVITVRGSERCSADLSRSRRDDRQAPGAALGQCCLPGTPDRCRWVGLRWPETPEPK